MTITFLPNAPRSTPNTTVAFDAEYNGAHVICEISAEALDDHFGAISLSDTDLVAAFEGNRGIIEAAARGVLPHRAPTGRCFLVSADF